MQVEKKQGRGDGMITISAPVPRSFDREFRIKVAERGVPSKAEAIRRAMAEWMDSPRCPQCGGPTVEHPDGLMVEVRYCERCEESVAYDGNNGGGQEG